MQTRRLARVALVAAALTTLTLAPSALAGSDDITTNENGDPITGVYEVTGGHLQQDVKWSASGKTTSSDGCFNWVDTDEGEGHYAFKAKVGSTIELASGVDGPTSSAIAFGGTASERYGQSEHTEPLPHGDDTFCPEAQTRAPDDSSKCGTYKIPWNLAIELGAAGGDGNPSGFGLTTSPLIANNADPFGHACPSYATYEALVISSRADGERPDFTKDKTVHLRGEAKVGTTPQSLSYPGTIEPAGWANASISWSLDLKRVARYPKKGETIGLGGPQATSGSGSSKGKGGSGGKHHRHGRKHRKHSSTGTHAPSNAVAIGEA